MHGAGGVLFLQVLFLQCGVSFRVSNGEELPLRIRPRQKVKKPSQPSAVQQEHEQIQIRIHHGGHTLFSPY